MSFRPNILEFWLWWPKLWFHAYFLEIQVSFNFIIFSIITSLDKKPKLNVFPYRAEDYLTVFAFD